MADKGNEKEKTVRPCFSCKHWEPDRYIKHCPAICWDCVNNIGKPNWELKLEVVDEHKDTEH